MYYRGFIWSHHHRRKHICLYKPYVNWMQCFWHEIYILQFRIDLLYFKEDEMAGLFSTDVGGKKTGSIYQNSAKNTRGVKKKPLYKVTQKTGNFEMRSGSNVQLAALRNRDLELQTTSPFSNHVMIQFLSIFFFFWISSIFVGFFKSSPFFCVSLYYEKF